MRRIELRVDVTGATELGGELGTAVLVCLPEPERLPPRPVVAFCWPGSGYSRGYFDIRADGHDGYSQAEHHARRGVIVVACDHLGVGDSSEPDRSQLTYANVAAVNRATVDDVLRRLAGGEVEPGYPAIVGPLVIGMGHSYGGFFLVVQQGRQRTFDAIAVLGWSAVELALPRPHPSGTGAGGARLAPLESLGERELMTYAFHWEDVPEALVARDMERDAASLPMWASGRRPGGRHFGPAPAPTAPWAAVIECPVLVAMGERDLAPDPHLEPAAYRRANDVTLFVGPRMAHIHNFAGTRHRLWDRLASWIEGVAAA